MDSTIYRTYDIGLRQARHDLLTKAALAASAVVEGTPFEIRVTGSTSRGETHPWSDLDLLLRRRPDADLEAVAPRYEIMDAMQEAGLDAFDIIDEETLFESLRKPMLDSAIPAAEIPSLGELPHPDVVLPRCAMSLGFCRDRVVKHTRDRSDLSSDTEKDILALIESSGRGMAVRTMVEKFELAIRRLAVFQDGGRSAYLDRSSTSNLEDLLARLSQPATEPIARPAIFPADAVQALLEVYKADDEYEVKQEVVDAGLLAIDQWIELLSVYPSSQASLAQDREDAAMRP